MDTWSYSWAIRNLIAEFLMPPGIWLLIILVALICIRRIWLKNTIIVFALMGIWISSTNFFAIQLVQWTDSWMSWAKPPNWIELENQVKLNLYHKQVIVVLGGGRRRGAFESVHYQNQDLSSATLDRLRVAAQFSKKTNLPILVSGGVPDRTTKDELSEAELMALVLNNEFSITARWIENQSNNTDQNAREALKILSDNSVETIYLVTDFLHMPRAIESFNRASKSTQQVILIIPIATSFFRIENLTPQDLYPGNLNKVRRICHEILSKIYYQLNH